MYDIFFQEVKNVVSMKSTALKALHRLEIFLLRDLVFYKPTSSNIIDTSSDIKNFYDGKLVQIEVIIDEIFTSSSRRSPTKISVSNSTGSLLLVFFNKIPTFIYNSLKRGTKHIISGKVQFFDGNFQITHPEFLFKKELVTEIEPVYPLTYGLTNKQLYGYILSAINAIDLSIKTVFEFSNIDDSEQAYIEYLLRDIKNLHLVGFKSDHDTIKNSINDTIKSLSTKELFANQLSMLKVKNNKGNTLGKKFSITYSIKDKILNKLGFQLTDGQKNSIDEIELDQASDLQMMRLLQGDVGSGKTLVALIAIMNVVSSGAQSALMAPTDLLAVQHFEFFKHAIDNSSISLRLLTGKTTVKDAREIKSDLADGKIDILIGTHALFQSGVNFKNLGLVVIDEQHRFGVAQRMELISKTSNPDVLIMTATPIPRSLTLTIFGDITVSQLKSKPKERLPIITSIISNKKQDEVIASLKNKINLCQKIYWVCPLIDKNDEAKIGNPDSQNEKMILSNITERYAELEAVYPGKVSILHGKMKQNDKDNVMKQFKEGKISILVATTVIEVGIDVPDATLIIIDNAEKFGLAQLHQLRGRVGRGKLQSHCMMIYNPKYLSKLAKQRLEIIRKSNDGFYIAEQDLLLRGGGEILGTKQSGEPKFFFADLTRDLNILLNVTQRAKQQSISSFTDFQIKLFDRDKLDFIKSG